MDLIVLGSGTSHGVPMIGCTCEVCLSPDPRNKRFRPSILVSTGEGNILVDTGPELRMQALANGVSRVDAVLFTHTHADHIFGLDDLRRFNDLSGKEIPVFGAAETLEDIRRIYPYIFKEVQAPGGKPRISLQLLEKEMELLGVTVTTLPVWHGSLPVCAFRFDERSSNGDFCSAAYVTDVSAIPPETMDSLRNLDLLVLDAVRFDPHPTHFGLWQAVEVVEQLEPAQALFTHLSHRFEHTKVNAALPSTMQLAYDGQRISL